MFNASMLKINASVFCAELLAARKPRQGNRCKFSFELDSIICIICKEFHNTQTLPCLISGFLYINEKIK